MSRRGLPVVAGLLALTLLLGGLLAMGPVVRPGLSDQASAQTATGAFLAFWEGNGGAARFGAPVSDALSEADQTVQYFERAKLVQAADGSVSLAPLGRELNAQRYPAGIFTPTGVEPARLPGGVGTVEPSTGITVPAAFLAIWHQYQGAASLGAPVSVVFREGGRLVQYFETGVLGTATSGDGATGPVEIGVIGRLAHGRVHAAPQPPQTAASLSILADLASNVAGEITTVATIVPAGAEPHGFEPSPADAATVAGASVLFVNGLHVEEWLDDMIANAGRPDLRVVTLSEGLPLVGQGSQNPEYDEGNPHLWLDPTLAMAYVMTIRDTLGELDPANGPVYDANAARYLATLRDLDSAIAQEVAKVPPANRKLMTFHDAWPYFANRYGFANFAVHQANPEADVSAQEYAQLVELIRREQIRVIFGEAGFNPKTLQQLARDTGVLFVDDLYGDTLAESGPFATYVGMMQHDVSMIVDTLK